MNDFPEPSLAELAEFNLAWAVTDQIEAVQLRIAKAASLNPVSHADAVLQEARLAELGSELASLEKHLKTALPVVAAGASGGVEPWKEKARARAREIIKRDGTKDLHPSQIHIADEIAKQFRLEGVRGSDGKPLTGAYIKRHALKGISSAQSKLASTGMHQSK